MFNLFENIVQKQRHIIVKEKDVMTVLKGVTDIKQHSKIHTGMSMEIGNCKWADDPDAWFMMFTSTTGQWRKLITVLKEQGYTMVLDDKERFYVKKGAEGQK